jgi:hypothetical protein
MQHRIDSAQSLLQRPLIANIAEHKLNLILELRRLLTITAVNLFAQAIQHTNLMSLLQQRMRRMRPDKTRASCDQNFLTQNTLPIS